MRRRTIPHMSARGPLGQSPVKRRLTAAMVPPSPPCLILGGMAEDQIIKRKTVKGNTEVEDDTRERVLVGIDQGDARRSGRPLVAWQSEACSRCSRGPLRTQVPLL